MVKYLLKFGVFSSSIFFCVLLVAQSKESSFSKSLNIDKKLEELTGDKNTTPASKTYAALIAKSPFKSIAVAPSLKGNVQNPKAVQFLGFTKIDGKLEFSIYDPVSQRGYWLSLNKRNNEGIYVDRYDEVNSTISVYLPSSGRQTLKLLIPEEAPKGIDSKSRYNYTNTPVSNQTKDTKNNEKNKFQRVRRSN